MLGGEYIVNFCEVICHSGGGVLLYRSNPRDPGPGNPDPEPMGPRGTTTNLGLEGEGYVSASLNFYLRLGADIYLLMFVRPSVRDTFLTMFP